MDTKTTTERDADLPPFMPMTKLVGDPPAFVPAETEPRTLEIEALMRALEQEHADHVARLENTDAG